MRFFGDMKTRTKILAGFLLICGLTAGLGGYAVFQLSQVNGSTVQIATKSLPGVQYTSDMNTNTSDIRLKEYKLCVVIDDPQAVAQTEKERLEILAAFDKNRAAYEPLIADPQERKLYDEFSSLWTKYLAASETYIAACREGRKAEAKEMLLAGRETFDPASAKLLELVQASSRNAGAARVSAQATYESARLWTIGLLGAAVAAGIALALWIGGTIARPLSKAVEVLRVVAAGDFTARLDIDTKDEVGQMAAALNTTVGSVQTSVGAVREALEKVAEGDFLAQVAVEAEHTEIGRMAVALNKTIASVRASLEEVRNVADTVASASQQLSGAAEEISSGAQEQASSLEETASSLEEITGTVRQNAESAQQASQLAAGARDVAEKGGQVVARAVEGMAEINKASKKIADIITAIDEIAFQTNLLALNAAVEAARAGEQGRGFAVVAGEVRNLAQRSAAAAKEIKELIGDSVRKVESGTELVNASGRTLEEIVTSVKRVTDIVAEIAAASTEQATGIDQVSRAVAQMDTVTQSNASQTEELSGTAEGLAGQAVQLQDLVGKFKLGNGAPVREATPRPQAQAPKAVARPAAHANGKPSVAGPSNAKPARKPVANGRVKDGLAAEHELDLVGAVAGGPQAGRLNGRFEEF
jgi:methyl-accepting chemotaxis protein